MRIYWYYKKTIFMMHCVIWYHLYNLKNVKKTHGGVLTLVKLQAEACNFTKINTPPWGCFSRFLNCTNGTKSLNASHLFCLPSSLLLWR